ncbi:extended synaptotagmin-1 [Cheilinus undulatus]|uniref:extended synaptotagmin-1 n=1 Tax=Cheilinus undulatus TaxID=241271 RepID=UPI001BD5EE08|nr:extended synaptotagmin-1 [Cheilinus undulatus]
MPPSDAEPGMSGGTTITAPAPASHPPGERAVSVLWSFGKCLGALLPVYLAGYYGFSISVVLLGLMIYMGWKHSRLEKVMRLKSAMYLLENERAFTTEKVFRTKRDLPPWINFPDVEKVEWLNKILQQAWPFIGQFLEKLLVETIAPAIRASSIHLQTLSFTKVNIGDKALKVAGIKAHTEHDKRQVMLDLYLSYAGDVEINVEIKKYFCKAGVKGVQLHGKLRVILEPLIGDIPLVGAVTMFFIRRPKLDINWTGLTNLLDIPGLNAMSDTMIMDAIASHLVLPNRLTVPLVADLHVAQLRSPLPRGVVRIHLLEAEDLTAKDTVIKGLIDGKSDPYAVLRVGTQIFTSHHVDSNLNPQWREMFEVIVHEVPGQELEVEVFDKDPDQDDFLGRVKVDLDIVKKARVVDDWFNLKDVPSGSVHLRLEWLSLLSSADRLSEVIQKNQNLTSKTADPPSAAVLAIYLDQAHALPMRKGNKDPSPMVQISIQDATKESKTCYGTNSPVWEDAFTFFIQDPRKQDIDIQVKDDDRALSLGSLTIPLTRILATPELTMDQWFQLENSGSASRIYIKIVLRVLWLSDDATPTTPSPRPLPSGSGPGQGGITSELNPMGPGGLAKPPPARPQHTTPDPEFATEGVLRIHLLEAQNLIAKDNFMGGMVKGKSDPYVKIRVAGITYRSHTIKENLNPIWNELYEVILTRLPGQEIQFELFDKDIDQDDFLGRFKLSLRDIISAQFIDTWYTLNDVKSGRVHLVLEWLPRVSDLPRLEQILLFQSQQSYQNKVVPSAAVLFVYVERAHGLPLKKSGKEPKVGADVILKGVSHRTKICERSTSPRWDEAFHFLVRDPKEETLTVKLSHSWGQALGSLTLPLREVLVEPGLVLDRWLNLEGALPESQILLRVVLKILDTQLAVCRRAPGEVGSDVSEEEVIPRWVPSHLDIRQRSGYTLTGDCSVQAGQVKLTIGYSTEESRLFITVHACRALAACSKDGADPYVTFILLPDKKATTKRRTATKKRDLNPEFNERFDFDFSLEESIQRRLDLSVKNSVSFMSRERELIGKLQLDLDQVDLKAGAPQWYDLVAEAN